MMQFGVIVSICLSYALFGECAKLPSSWGRCHKSDKDFPECLRKNIEDVINKLNKPTPELGLSSLDPLEIPELYIGEGKGPVNVAQHYKNVKLYGLTNVKILKANADFKKHQLTATSLSPQLRLEADYNMKGQVLLLPIVGDGPCNVTLDNVKINHILTWEEVEKKGKIYMKPTDFTITLSPEKVTFKFDNLFNGQKELGDNINKVLNDSWDEVFTDVREGYEKSFALIFKGLATQVLPKVPEKDIFLE